MVGSLDSGSSGSGSSYSEFKTFYTKETPVMCLQTRLHASVPSNSDYSYAICHTQLSALECVRTEQ